MALKLMHYSYSCKKNLLLIGRILTHYFPYSLQAYSSLLTSAQQFRLVLLCVLDVRI